MVTSETHKFHTATSGFILFTYEYQLLIPSNRYDIENASFTSFLCSSVLTTHDYFAMSDMSQHSSAIASSVSLKYHGLVFI